MSLNPRTIFPVPFSIAQANTHTLVNIPRQVFDPRSLPETSGKLFNLDTQCKKHPKNILATELKAAFFRQANIKLLLPKCLRKCQHPKLFSRLCRSYHQSEWDYAVVQQVVLQKL
jgi:hypothetical protein